MADKKPLNRRQRGDAIQKKWKTSEERHAEAAKKDKKNDDKKEKK